MFAHIDSLKINKNKSEFVTYYTEGSTILYGVVLYTVLAFGKDF